MFFAYGHFPVLRRPRALVQTETCFIFKMMIPGRLGSPNLAKCSPFLAGNPTSLSRMQTGKRNELPTVEAFPIEKVFLILC